MDKAGTGDPLNKNNVIWSNWGNRSWIFPDFSEGLSKIGVCELPNEFFAVNFILLYYGKRMHAKDICDELNLTPMTTDRILRILEREGYVRKIRRWKGFHIDEYWEAINGT